MFTCFGSDGAKIYKFDGSEKIKLLENIRPSESLSLKKLLISRCGKQVFILDNNGVHCIHLDDMSSNYLDAPEGLRIAASPCGKLVFVFRSYVASPNNENPAPNVLVFDSVQRKLIKEYVHRSPDGWQPQWNVDSSVCAFHWNGEIQFFNNNELGEKPIARLAVKGMRHFSLSSTPKTPNVAIYIPSQKDQPSNIRVFQLRNGQCTAITNKSFYRADTVRFLWNDRGTDLLVLTSTKLSDESYYGDQALHYLTTSQSRDTAIVVLPRKGPIYQIAWKPQGAGNSAHPSEEMFVVCHGFMPASVTVFGTDCEPRFNFGTGAWNQLYFNPQGNLLLVAGLGSLTGDMCVWDFNRREQLSAFKTTDVTSVSWLNDGQHLLFATTTPRLRVNNGFGIWHYSGKKVLYEKVAQRAVPRPATFDLPAATEHELYEVQVIPQHPLPPAPKAKKFDPIISTGDTVSSSTASGGVYVPPALRNRSAVAKQAAAASGMSAGPGGSVSAPKAKLPVGFDIEMCNTGKQNKRKKAKKPATNEEPQPITKTTTAPPDTGASTIANAEKSKISQLRKKLAQIEKLKSEQASGKQLAFNQLDKLATEDQLRAELAQLTLSN